MNLKMEFELESLCQNRGPGRLKIIGKAPKHTPYVVINVEGKDVFIQDKDLEKVAVNILKALKSKKLKG